MRNFPVVYYRAEVVFPNGKEMWRNQIGMKDLDDVMEWITQQHNMLGLTNPIRIERQNESLWLVLSEAPCEDEYIVGHIFAVPMAQLEKWCDTPPAKPSPRWCPDCGGECDELLATLKLSLEALDTSEPKQKHYPEPVARHKKATVGVTKAIKKLSQRR